MTNLSLHIEGMSCGHCLNAVRQALGEVPGVEVISIQMGRARVSYDEGLTGPSQIEAAVADAGYSATATPS
jgi:copper chaperone